MSGPRRPVFPGVFVLVVASMIGLLLLAGCNDSGSPNPATGDSPSTAADLARIREQRERDDALRNDPAYRTRKGRIENFARQGQSRQARQELETALALDPLARDPWELASRLADGSTGLDWYAKLEAAHPGNAHAAFFRGHRGVLDGRWPEAEAGFRRALELEPAYPDAAYRLGVVLSTRGDFDGAVEAFRRSLQANPRSERDARMLAVTLKVVGKNEEAAAVIDRALGQHPDSAELQFMRGLAALRAGSLEVGEAALRRALEIDETHHGARRELAALAGRAGDRERAGRELELAERYKDYQELGGSLEERMAASRDGALALLRGEIALTVDRPEEALQWADRAEALAGPAERILALRGCARFQQGEAPLDTEQAAGLAGSTDPRVQLALAAQALQENDLTNARRWIAKATAGERLDRSFLRRASDLAEAAGDQATAGELRRVAATAGLM